MTFTSAWRTKIGSTWNDASSTTAASSAPGSASRHVTWAFVSHVYAVSRKTKIPTSDAATEMPYETIEPVRNAGP